MPALALDIGSYAIKAVVANPGEKPKISQVLEVFNPHGIALPTDDGAAEKLKLVIQDLFTTNKLPTEDVRLSLPETVVSTKLIEVPPLTDAELASAINWQAERHIPIPPEELSLEYQVLHRPEKNENKPMRVLLVGVRKQIVNRFVELFQQQGIEPTLVETQMLSIVRSLQFLPEDPTTLIAHLGASSLVLGVVADQELKFVVAQLSGSQILSKTIEKAINLEPSQAEEYKRSFGLDPNQLEGKIRTALLPQVDEFVNHMRKAIQFYGSQNPQAGIKRVVLSGGASLLPDFLQHVASQLNLEVLMAAPFSATQGQVPESTNHPSYSVCVGLLLRDI